VKEAKKVVLFFLRRNPANKEKAEWPTTPFPLSGENI
jgi:hypothetical protein